MSMFYVNMGCPKDCIIPQELLHFGFYGWMSFLILQCVVDMFLHGSNINKAIM